MFNRDMEDILKHPKLTFRDESYKIWVKNTQDRIDGMSGLAEEKISEPKGIVIETINETSRENKKYEENISDLIGQLELAQYAYN